MKRSRTGILIGVIQKIFLSPALKTYLKLLTAPSIEIKEIIEQELSSNPLLEIEVSSQIETRQTISLNDWIDLSLISLSEGTEEEAISEEEEDVSEDELDKILKELTLNELFGEASESEEDFDPLENLKKSENLRECLYEQCQRININEEERDIAYIIIDNIDEKGFLSSSPEEISKREKVEIDLLNRVRERLMRELHPDGIGALNFEEFLTYQLESRFHSDSSLLEFIKKCSEILSSLDSYKKIREVGISIDELKENLKKLRRLRPFPLYGFHLEEIEYPNADLIVNKTEKGYVLTLNDESIPRLRVNRYYLNLLKQPDLDPETKAFLKSKKKSAEWFIKSLDIRNKTVYKVAEAIIEYQKEFLERGVDFIKPMKMKDVAEKIGVDESTVSRAIANKSISTEHGVLPLRFFFHSAIDSERGEKVSSVYIKNMIKGIIENENKDNPLSDSEILNLLRRQGIKIARRTVAKYREELGILPANMRKKMNVLGVKT
ncbi:MAG: RNA polymerase factor sigma-54 [Candidatus Aminicenantia bacterium]